MKTADEIIQAFRELPDDECRLVVEFFQGAMTPMFLERAKAAVEKIEEGWLEASKPIRDGYDFSRPHLVGDLIKLRGEGGDEKSYSVVSDYRVLCVGSADKNELIIARFPTEDQP